MTAISCEALVQQPLQSIPSRITPGHRPRHAKVYRDFRAELDRLQQERIAAFSEYAADVDTGRYPEDHHVVGITDDEFDEFLASLD